MRSRITVLKRSEMSQRLEAGRDTRISIFIGTKAQFIKMVPIVREFERRHWPYRLIDTGQHGALVRKIIEEFGVREPDIRLFPSDKGVSTLTEGLRWILYLTKRYLLNGNATRRAVFGGVRGIGLVHGDTMSTFLSTLIARRAGQDVAHVEAGLRSWNYFHPFPEEIVRIWVMRMSRVLFAPSRTAAANLSRMGLGARTHELSANTSIDVVRHDLSRPAKELPGTPERYSVATIHRLETLYNRKRLNRAVDLIIKAQQQTPVFFVQHPPTAKRLAAAGLTSRLAEAGVILIPLLDHVSFLHLVSKARFIISDGGSIQEEAFYLGVPCLVLRETTERDEGLGENVLLSGFDDTKTERFLENPETYRRKPTLAAQESPSAQIADLLEKHLA